MNNNEFAKSFALNLINFETYHYTDNRVGVNYNYIGYLESGHARLVGENKVVEIKAGEAVYIPSNYSYQSYWYADDTKGVILYSLGFSFFPDQQKRFYSLQKVILTDEEKNMAREAVSKNISLCIRVGKLYSLFGKVLQRLEFRSMSRREREIENVIELMAKNFKFSVADAAKEMGLSQPRFYVIFKEATGMTPIEMKNKIFAAKATELLTDSGFTVEYISDMLGLSSAAYLRRILKKHTGKTPKEIRKDGGIRI